MSSENLLIVADSERDADILYAVGMFVPDPFIYLRVDGKPMIVLSDLEIDRAKKEAPHCQAIALSQCQQALRRGGRKQVSLAQVIAHLAKKLGLKKFTVPTGFPLGLARQLKDLKVKVKPARGPFFPERQVKSADEVKKISAALMMAEVGMAEGIQALRRAKVGKGGRLFLRDAALTSEKLRSIIDVGIIQAGGLAAHTIVAGGKQGCDPHERGHGPLKANEPIILDIFPRSQKTGYFGDITRTVVKGRASEAVRKLYDTVNRSQELAFGLIRPGVRGADVHLAVVDFFAREGYKTGRHNGHMQGFFHGTGHGLGLDLHEWPRMGPTSEDVFQPGHVVTVEPGLYYPALGGARIEDVVQVTADGIKNLTKFEKVLEV